MSQTCNCADLTADEQVLVEAHLTDCEQCRSRIDLLDVMPEMQGIAGAKTLLAKTESPRLRVVMERLSIESQLSTCSANFTASASRDVLPILQPTTRRGFIGRLGDIEVLKVIGRGGMGVVFEGIDSILNRTVAVKVLSPHLVGNGEAKSRFLREAQAAAALSHENVVAIHSIEEADGMPYLVLQFVDGESLAQRLIHDPKLAFPDVVRMGIQLARGLAAAHKHGLVHRDIKPANILIEVATGDVRIADFGLAKHTGSDTITVEGTIAGTPAYMSPEQTINADLDARSDLFSLGVVLYEASTGISPFVADSSFVVLDRIRNANPLPMCEVNSEIPAWFGSVVQRLLEKNADDRIQTAAEIVELLVNQTTVAPAIRLNKYRSRRLFVGATLVGAALVGAIGLLIGLSMFSVKPKPPTFDPPSVGFVVNGPNGTNSIFQSLAEAIHLALDGSVIDVYGNGPFITPAISIEGKRLTIRAALGATPRFLPDMTGDQRPSQFLSSDEDLQLEGIEVIWPISVSQNLSEDFSQRCVIGNSNGKLSLAYCRIVAGPNAVCVASVGREIELKHSHFVSQTGACIAWRPTVATIGIEYCFLKAKTAFFTMAPSSGGPTTAFQFKSNTIVSERTFSFIANNAGATNMANRRPMTITATRNLIDSQAIVTFYTIGGFQQNSKASEKMNELLRNSVAWKDDSNVYGHGSMYLAGNPPFQPQVILSSELKSLDQWLSFWKQTRSKSIEGKISFKERTNLDNTSMLQLSNIDSPLRPIPPNIGAIPANIGPGQAYHDVFRRTRAATDARSQ